MFIMECFLGDPDTESVLELVSFGIVLLAFFGVELISSSFKKSIVQVRSFEPKELNFFLMFGSMLFILTAIKQSCF